MNENYDYNCEPKHSDSELASERKKAFDAGFVIGFIAGIGSGAILFAVLAALT